MAYDDVLTRNAQGELCVRVIGNGGGGGGAVDSVNGKTGNVFLTALDVNAIPQLETMPEPTAEYEGKVVQYVGEDGQYLSGHFYLCKWRAWTQAPIVSSVNGQDGDVNLTAEDLNALPVYDYSPEPSTEELGKLYLVSFGSADTTGKAYIEKV